MPLVVDIPLDSVSAVVGGAHIVPSKSVPGTFRLVMGRGNECSCPATGPSCRHRRLVAAYVKAQDYANRRPSVPVNVSLMVD